MPTEGSTTEQLDRTDKPYTLSELVKFTGLSALLAIFYDAAVGHAMLWANDPYWTYWITDTLLMATVFGLGTAWLGIGLRQGALITVVHVLLLTIYYWSLSPIGLPSQPQWLDLEHTWITGLPVHFAVYYLGYVTALWLWRRRQSTAATRQPGEPHPLLRSGLAALLSAAAIVLLGGVLQTVIAGDFPGITWFIMRIAVACPFILAWWASAGTDKTASVAGGFLLALLLVAYGHYLSPMGLPNAPIRLLFIDPPPAEVQWLSYRPQFLIVLPLMVLTAVAVLLFGSPHSGNLSAPPTRKPLKPTLLIGAVIVLAAAGTVAALYGGDEADRVSVSGAGPISLGTGTVNAPIEHSATGDLHMIAADQNTHRTPLPPHDSVRIVARISGANGVTYEIEAIDPLVTDPLGRFTTWYGVGLNVWHHGRSGIGIGSIPPTYSPVAVFALARIRTSDQVVVSDVPIFVMTTSGAANRLELIVGDPSRPVPALPGGHLRAVWTDFRQSYSRTGVHSRYLFGGAVLIVLLVLALALVRAELEANTETSGMIS
jgi:hypothetical protein